jgi:hypothetical protein
MSNHPRSAVVHPLPHIRRQPSDMPAVADVDALGHPPATKALRELHDMLAEARQSIRDVERGRFKGATWLEAEQADREAILRGEQPTALADLIAGEPQRFGRCLALVSTLEGRLDDRRQRASGMFAKAAHAARQRVTELADDAAHLATDGWGQRGTPRGLVQLEDAERLVGEAEHLVRVAQWLDGTDDVLAAVGTAHVPLDPAARGIFNASAHDKRGTVPRRWTDSMGERPDSWTPAAGPGMGMTLANPRRRSA